MRKTRVFWFGALMGLVGCGAPPVPAAPMPASASNASGVSTAPGASNAEASPIHGSVRGRVFTTKSAVYIWRDKANDMQIVLADVDNLCASISAGGWPPNATIVYMSLKHNTADNRNAPFTAGEYGLRTGDERAAQDMKNATYMQIDASCAPMTRFQAVRGNLHLSTPVVKLNGVVEGNVDLGMGRNNEPVSGHFTATYCQLPDEELHGCH